MSRAQFQSFPPVTVPVAMADGTPNPVWWRAWQTLWLRLGGSSVNYNEQITITGTEPQGTLPSGQTVMFLVSTDNPAEPVVGGASTWDYTATVPGTLGVSDGAVTLTRGARSQFCGLLGGAVFMQRGDVVTVSAAPTSSEIGYFAIGQTGIGQTVQIPSATFFPV